jgi:hypothetical protein|nr:MAG TPA: hypothetical protein [Caudoviricetes sp.]DAK47872.1 MAG TPA: hypothetical protein [Caudoviricetes sp.]DAN32080.1 MAG TPA: hypothetical protein [Caudoviricetes sp.]
MKIKVLKEFQDIHTSHLYEEGDVVEVSEERYEEMTKNLSAYDYEYIEEVKEVVTDETIQDQPIL